MRLSRRRFLTFACMGCYVATHDGANLLYPIIPSASANTNQQKFYTPSENFKTHGLSAFGDLKYSPEFSHFDYAMPDAVKGGRFSQQGPRVFYNQDFLTFNSLNSYILSGDGAQGMELCFASLMKRAFDEADSVYGYAAKSVQYERNRNRYIFELRDGLRFEDGSALTSEDVVFSLQLLQQEGHPLISQPMRFVEDISALDSKRLAIRLSENAGRDLILTISQYPIFSAAYYSENNFSQSTLKPPLGSGPYKVGRFEAGRYIEYERVKNWWGEAINSCVGHYNFDVIRYEFFRDRDVALEAFKAKEFLFREEFVSRDWAESYDFPAIRSGAVKRRVLNDNSPAGVQGWFINTRREKFSNPLLREALINAFDFEWTNKNLMYDSYQRTHSYFENSPLKAQGLPSSEELNLMQPIAELLPKGSFDEVYSPPASDGSGRDRGLLRYAGELLDKAGWSLKNGQRVDENDEPLMIEFLYAEGSLSRHTNPFIANLNRLGIMATIRIVDPAQYTRRLNQFEFDLVVRRFSGTLTPGAELRQVFGSESASIEGSQNLAGIRNQAIDMLIEAIINADNRNDLTFACRALDRVLRAGKYIIPHWYKASHWIAYWDEFSYPEQKPAYDRGVRDLWMQQ